MKILSATFFCVLISSAVLAQNAPTSSAPGAQASTQDQMPAAMEMTLKKYVSAYERRSMPDLLSIWPELQNQKKEFERIKKHFGDGNVSNEHVSLHPLETQTLKDDAVVRCERTEQFAKVETAESVGDLGMGRYPSQSPGPHGVSKPVKKKDTVWVKLHKDHDDWVIVSMSEKPLSL